MQSMILYSGEGKTLVDNNVFAVVVDPRYRLAIQKVKLQRSSTENFKVLDQHCNTQL